MNSVNNVPIIFQKKNYINFNKTCCAICFCRDRIFHLIISNIHIENGCQSAQSLSFFLIYSFLTIKSTKYGLNGQF